MEVEAERLLEDGGRSGGEEAVSGVRRVCVRGWLLYTSSPVLTSTVSRLSGRTLPRQPPVT